MVLRPERMPRRSTRWDPLRTYLEGAISMVHLHTPGTNVMSTFFDPALISTFGARISFLQETLACMDVFAGVQETVQAPSGLRLSQNPASDRVELRSAEGMQEVVLRDTRGTVVLKQALSGSPRTVSLDVAELASGTYLVSATSPGGTRVSTLLLKE